MQHALRDIDDYQRAYAQSDFEPVQARLRKRKLLEVLDAWRPKRLLEIGCADDAIFNHHRGFEHCCVVEPGAGFAALARQHAERLGFDATQVSVIAALMEDALPQIGTQRFDAVLVSGLLHELADPAALMATVAQVCDAGTQVHVNVPNARSLHRLLALEMGLIDSLHAISNRQQTLQQHHTFDLDRLAALCEGAGFDVIERGSYFVKPFTHQQMAQLQADGLIDELMLDGLYKLERHLPGLGSEVYVHLRLREGARG